MYICFVMKNWCEDVVGVDTTNGNLKKYPYSVVVIYWHWIGNLTFLTGVNSGIGKVKP